MDRVVDGANARRANEDGGDVAAAEGAWFEVRLKGIDLAAEGVAFDGHRHQVQGGTVERDDLFGEQDGAGAGAPDWQTAAAESDEGLSQVVGDQQSGDGGALAAGDDQAVDVLELVDRADLERLSAGASERGGVLGEVALQRENADVDGLSSVAASSVVVRDRPHLRGRRLPAPLGQAFGLGDV